MRVSAIIPTYNNAQTLARAIDSALTQAFDGPWEIIIVNDGSTDHTAEIIAGYGGQVRSIEQSNAGAAAARNAGVRAAQGDYLAFLDADDEWTPRKLQVMTAVLEGSPEAVLAYSDFIAINPLGERSLKTPMHGSPSLDDLLDHGFGFFPTVLLVRRTAFLECGGFSEEFHGAGFEDAFFALTAREREEFVHVNQPLALYYEAEPAITAVKYRNGLRVLARLVRDRYGARRSRKLIARANAYYAALLVSAAAEHMKRKKIAHAAASLLEAATVSPASLVQICRASWRRQLTNRRSRRR